MPTVNRIVRRSDSLLVSDLIFVYQGETARASTSCIGAVCTAYLGGYDFGIDLRDLQDEGVDESLKYTAIGEKYGVRLSRVEGRSVIDGISTDTMSYVGWLNHSVFEFDLLTVRSGEASGLKAAAGISLGSATGSRPTGVAT